MPSSRFVIVADAAAAGSWVDAWTTEHPTGLVIASPHPTEWPFRHPLIPELPANPVVLRADGANAICAMLFLFK